MAKKEMKTNAMRILEREKVPFELVTYECEEFHSGTEVAKLLGQPVDEVYKTLVTVGKSKQYYVFVIPTNAEIDFKKAAKAVGEKSLEMIPLADLTKVTGYIRGGTTAVGMKKQFPTIIQEDAKAKTLIYVSGGKPGTQMQLRPDDLLRVARAKYDDVI
ncbi:Cys-tRNA(Pro) deacylase [Ohessyouella blattaphilus]|uniref:Cys-tRNA(Pro)/Cys-tRNA(Cys) deacylase n=1 Tax=Ohessyouella blattaphilus TaxID=2949333 RepID=A0ABT1EFF8_9FIRM|nr:Cys-tRNA(Pro) deacylase [Ohessyouella blattaphilus]MCP1109251.1 Cys-tRNA(Pro) deacylase [Ohessyouella blattaphilus]MCR8562645.1 Cys-tRNA(Pro) deacylase [Ohessyouella blattaphilus]